MPATDISTTQEQPAGRLIRALLFLGVFDLAMGGVIFHQAQNQAALPGGGVAAVKVAWLGTVLLCWYWLPLLMLLDRRLEMTRGLTGVFLGNMLARASIELAMMYAWHNWHPWHGISHDLFTAGLCLFLASRSPLSLIRRYFRVMAVLFLVESGFAWYMLHHVAGAGPVYFVPAREQHRLLLLVTRVVVAMTWAWLWLWCRQWFSSSLGKLSLA